MRDNTKQRRCRMIQGVSPSVIMVLLFLCLPVFAEAQYAEVSIGQNGLTVTSVSPQITYMELRVAAPSGEIVFDESSNSGSIGWDVPLYAQDGMYSWEIRLGNANAKRVRRTEGETRTIAVRAMRESGSFMILNGAIVNQAEEETSLWRSVLGYGEYALLQIADFIISPVYADQVILDDLIVDGSVCTGFDCVNGESFGFDTIRLKENNLRIRFMDTSNSASFPSRDWEVTVNDSSNGGANYFGITDIDGGKRVFTLEGGAPSHSLYVDDYGRVGFGTSVPVVELHMADGDTPTVRLDQDGTSGWPRQVWDVAGNEANFFIRDATNGSKLSFRIAPGAPTDSLTIKADGKVGIGTWSPTEKLHVVGNAFISGNLELGSSREVKNNIRPLESNEALQTFAKLQPVKFQYKVDPEEESIGFIAEEVPDLVATNSRKSISTMDVVAVMTKVVQEQQKAIEELNLMVQQLQAQLGEQVAVSTVPAVQ